MTTIRDLIHQGSIASGAERKRGVLKFRAKRETHVIMCLSHPLFYLIVCLLKNGASLLTMKTRMPLS